MSQNISNRKLKKRLSSRIRDILLVICLAISACIGVVYVADWVMAADDSTATKLQNGSFEEGPSFDGNYSQPNNNDVPHWSTTAYNTDGTNGLIELFKVNTGTYLSVPAVTLKPTDGEIAAELNADEESTLYQVVSTSPASIYEWGLDHGARTTKDVMALVIGPAQEKNPSKPNKAGRDQFMQMVDWLKSDANSSIKAQISAITAGDEPKHYTVYSKKFGEKGTFNDNAGDNAFSLTPSTIYTEKWEIWIMASSRSTTAGEENPWNSYGSNSERNGQSNTTSSENSVTPTSSSEEKNQEGSSTENNGSSSIDLSKYYLYTVPAKQTETLFGFVSISSVNKGPTFGNFLDNINFNIYHPLSGSSTIHGSAVVGGSDGSTSGAGSSSGHTITIDDKLATYVTDGEALKIQAVVENIEIDKDKKPDYDGCEFVGVYYTVQDKDGNPATKFLQLAGNEIKDTGSLTEEEKKGKWLKSTNAEGDTVYTYFLDNITTATDLHFVFIKSPTVTYDPNGGNDYVVERTYNTNEAANVYSFKPAYKGSTEVDATSGATADETFIPPYVSHAAEAPVDKKGNTIDGWKFMGWLLTGDKVDNIPSDVKQVNGDQLGSLLLAGVHTVACDYSVSEGSSQSSNQYFKIYSGSVETTEELSKDNEVVKGVTWKDNGETIIYANVHKGLTMVAQWRWLQAFIPQVGSGTTYTDSANGGTVEITSVTNTSDENYNAAYNTNGGKSYHAETDETITATATAEEGYTFEGWYDADGNLITTNTTYSYVETKESVNTYYARFSGSVTQTYIRQVKNGDTWEDITDDKIGTLGRYTYTDAAGTSISSTATAGTGYKFVGWYDVGGNKVADTMLTNNGTTISYTTTEDATYYARFETAYTVKFAAQTKQENGSFKTDTVGGKVSVASVTDVDGKTASSIATTNSGYKFLGWYDSSGNQLSTNATYSTTTTSATNGVTYYARFEIVYTPTVESQVYLSFVAESAGTQIPSVFDGRNAGTGKNTNGYGLDNKFGNTISTGFKYSLNTMTDVSTIQITVTVPDSAYVKVGGTGSFPGNGTSILTDSAGVTHNKGSIQQISSEQKYTYYWDATGLQANTTYGFIIDNLYAPGATATITINGTSGIKVTNDNGVVNTASENYKSNSHYSK